MFSSFGLALGALALALGASACATVDPSAIKVGDSRITIREFDQHLEELADGGIVEKTTSGVPLIVAPDSLKVGALGIAQFALGSQVTGRELSSLGIPVTDADIATATDEVKANLFSGGGWDEVAPATQKFVALGFARQAVLSKALEASVTEDEIVALYESAGGEAANGPLEQIRPQVVSSVIGQKIGALPAKYASVTTVDPRFGIFDETTGTLSQPGASVNG